MGVAPWTGVARELGRDATTETPAAMVAELGLDWTVNLQALQGVDGSPMPGWRGLFRSDTREGIGVAKSRYQMVQNVDAFAGAHTLAQHRRVRVLAGGALHRGARAFVLATIGAVDVAGRKLEQLVVFWNGHGVGMGIKLQTVPYLPSCANTLPLRFEGAKILHTGGAPERLRRAGLALADAKLAYAELVRELEGLERQRFGMEAMLDFAQLILQERRDATNAAAAEAETPTRTGATRRRREVETLLALFEEGEGCRGKTKLDALLAVTEFWDHFRTRVQRGLTANPEAARLTDAWLPGHTATAKLRAVEVLKAWK